MPFVDHKFTKFSNNVEHPSYFSTPLPGCLYHVSFRRYLPLSLEVVENPNRCIKFFGPIYGRDDLDYSMTDC